MWLLDNSTIYRRVHYRRFNIFGTLPQDPIKWSRRFLDSTAHIYQATPFWRPEVLDGCYMTRSRQLSAIRD